MSSTPGERALVAMKNLSSKQISPFKSPAIPQKRKKVKILTEDKYVEEMGKIIQRDFFPDLEKLRAQNEYLDAMERNDVIKLRELYARYTGRRPTDRRGDSPATFETPDHNRPEDTPRSVAGSETSVKTTKSSEMGVSSRHSLDSFLEKYTSEDNHSFQEIIEKADQKLKQKFSVLFDAEEKSAIEIAKSLALPSIEKQFEAIEGPKTLDMWKYKNKNYIMYVPDGVDFTKAEQLEMAKNRQEVAHSNTRLNHNPFDEKQNKETISELAKTQAKGQIGKIGVDGNTIDSSQTPEIRGFRFERTPSPSPGVAESPLMTWGEIEGTPFRLDGSDTPIHRSTGPSFRIAENSRRENLALELAEKAGERMRGQKAKAMEAARKNIASPYIRSSLDRLSSMSPAAKRLASGKLTSGILTPKTKRSNQITPGITPRKTTPSPLIVKKKTPLRVSAPTPERSTITNNLLNIPDKRKRASDFF